MAKKFRVKARQIIHYEFVMEAESEESLKDYLVVTVVDNDDPKYSPKVTKYGSPAYFGISEEIKN